MTTVPDFEIGQRFYFAPGNRWDSDREVEVSKIGRKWVTLKSLTGCTELRIDKTGRNWRMVDGGDYTSPGNIYDSKSHYEDCVYKRKLIRTLHDATSYARIGIDDIPSSQIERAMLMLGITLPES